MLTCKCKHKSSNKGAKKRSSHVPHNTVVDLSWNEEVKAPLMPVDSNDANSQQDENTDAATVEEKKDLDLLESTRNATNEANINHMDSLERRNPQPFPSSGERRSNAAPALFRESITTPMHSRAPTLARFRSTPTGTTSFDYLKQMTERLAMERQREAMEASNSSNLSPQPSLRNEEPPQMIDPQPKEHIGQSTSFKKKLGKHKGFDQLWTKRESNQNQGLTPSPQLRDRVHNKGKHSVETSTQPISNLRSSHHPLVPEIQTQKISGTLLSVPLYARSADNTPMVAIDTNNTTPVSPGTLLNSIPENFGMSPIPNTGNNAKKKSNLDNLKTHLMRAQQESGITPIVTQSSIGKNKPKYIYRSSTPRGNHSKQGLFTTQKRSTDVFPLQDHPVTNDERVVDSSRTAVDNEHTYKELEEWKKRFIALDNENNSLKNTIHTLKKQMEQNGAVMHVNPLLSEPNIEHSICRHSTYHYNKYKHIAYVCICNGYVFCCYQTGLFSPQKEKQQQSTNITISPRRLKQVPSSAIQSWNWVPIENEYVTGTLWEPIGSPPIRNEDTVHIPKDFEDLFRKSASDEYKNGSEEKKDNTESEHIKYEELIVRINPQREKLIKEALHRIPLTPSQIRAYIVNVNDAKLGKHLIGELLALIPQKEEQKFVLHKIHVLQVKPSELTDVENFFYHLADLDLLDVKLKIWLSKFKVLFFFLFYFKSNKENLESSLEEKYKELCTFKNALAAIDKSESLRKMLKIVLAFGNFLHANTSGSKSKEMYGMYGFHLGSLRTLKSVKSRHDESFTLLTYIYSYCKIHFPEALQVIEDLKACHEATKCLLIFSIDKNIHIKELYNNIMSADEELIVFQRELRKYRELKIKKHDDQSKEEKDNLNTNEGSNNNKFEAFMSNFKRKARDNWGILLNLWNECITIANRVAQEYDYEFLQNDGFDQLIRIFDEFTFDLKKAGNYWEASQNKRKIKKNVLLFLTDYFDVLHIFLLLKGVTVSNEQHTTTIEKKKIKKSNVKSKPVFEELQN
ncbi:disheveled-associated activator of morphogenesis 1 [Reticulomyxa filosa]|uniref:Disheveled-associated activator of morphogenesis 1 n=1 Tax=Reticulomyxa filosa TaxID=46433 RepID=X6P357_RETFI|nr:disheveled-associated activator of morphogenesis 1 [Reticulomyxa filosa]|eukprot:ETO32514.1 disheveled-associated activator of morphogenesis 1 [Reticulomyxa filosa]